MTTVEYIESKISPAVREKLGFYIYLYLDPTTRKIFYVGKGCGSRVLSHLSQEGEAKKIIKIKEIRSQGLQPEIEILAHQLPNEECAYRIEAAVIDLLGLQELTNEVRGWKSIQQGRMSLQTLIGYYDAEPIEIAEPSLLFKVNKLYRHNMSELELFEITRGIWTVGIDREKAQYAFAVFEGVIREIYKIHKWLPSGTLEYHTYSPPEANGKRKRWEFDGSLANEEMRQKYNGKSVAKYFKHGQQLPFTYVNC